MKFLNRTLAFLAVAAIFGVSFVMGRISAVKSVERNNALIKEEAERAVAVLPLLRASEINDVDASPPASPAADAEAVIAIADAGQAVEEETEEPPQRLMLPVDGTVSEPYSLMSVYSETMKDWRAHTGMDIEASLSAAVKAAEDGTVARAYEDKLWGNVIEIEHRGGLKTVYKGVSTLSMVEVGDNVSAGETISGVGTAPAESKALAHLHFETWLDGVCMNPEYYVM